MKPWWWSFLFPETAPDETPRLYDHWSEVPKELWRWRNFRPGEPNLACPHCGRFYLDFAAMDKLQSLRDHMGAPLHLNSGHRCPAHNAAVGGAPLSQHKKIAFDIRLDSHDRRGLYTSAVAVGFKGIGFYQTFMHIDPRPTVARWHGNQRARELWTQVLS